MIRVSVFDLTEEQIEAAVAARQAKPEPARPEDAYWLAFIARERRVARKQEAERIASTRRCSRCGIDTTSPNLCIDCSDVLALERAS